MRRKNKEVKQKAYEKSFLVHYNYCGNAFVITFRFRRG